MFFKTSLPIIIFGLLKFCHAGTLTDTNANLNNILLDILSSGQEKNVAVSPISVLTGLGVLYEGMGDPSRSKVSIGFPSNHETFLKMFKTEGFFASRSKRTENMIVLDDKKEVKSDFSSALPNSLNAVAIRANLSTMPDKAISFINKRVKAATNDKIVDFLPPGSITSDTSLVLVNVLHFNAKWKTEFNSGLELAEFTKVRNNPKSRVNVKFMHGERMPGGYFKTATGTEIVSLPFEDENYAMVFVMPQTDLMTFIKTDLRNSTILSMIYHPDSLEQKSLFVSMPKFSIKTKAELKKSFAQRPELREFCSDSADYSRMAKEKVKVNEIYHMAVLDVNSGGVEASAATGITITLYSAFRGDNEVYLNSPFLFFIVEKPTKMILFGGYVSDPKE